MFFLCPKSTRTVAKLQNRFGGLCFGLGLELQWLHIFCGKVQLLTKGFLFFFWILILRLCPTIGFINSDVVTEEHLVG